MKRNIFNTIHCGDFLKKSSLLGRSRFDVVIADPPYNIGKDFGNDSDKQTIESYLEWTSAWLDKCMKHLSKTGIVYVYGFPEVLAHIAVQYPIDKQRWLVWHYTNKTVPGLKFWQRSHESILCLWKDRRPDLHIDLIREEYTDHFKKCIGKPRKETLCRFNQKGKKSVYNGHENGAMPRDVLKIPALAGGAGRKERWFLCRTCGNKLFSPNKLAEHRHHDVLKHPTQKPMELTQRLINSSVNGHGVLIPFAGSGSECVVAKKLQTRFFATEINREYVSFGKQWLKHDTQEQIQTNQHSNKQMMKLAVESSNR